MICLNDFKKFIINAPQKVLGGAVSGGDDEAYWNCSCFDGENGAGYIVGGDTGVTIEDVISDMDEKCGDGGYGCY